MNTPVLNTMKTNIIPKTTIITEIKTEMKTKIKSSRFVNPISSPLRFFILFTLALLSCSAKQGVPVEFKNYWYQGSAEINTYLTKQPMYGEMRTGNAVLIFVTEEFSSVKHVKLDEPEKNKEVAVPILKLNFEKRFITGIYPYNMLVSVFTPVDLKKNEKTFKVTASVQEWCGHTYAQLNVRKKGWRYQSYSYFESQGDQTAFLGEVLAEDELWTRLRIDPNKLPLGKMKLLPGLFSTRLRHSKMVATEAVASMNPSTNTNNLIYKVDYPTEKRVLQIEFTKEFPYKIIGWSESYPNSTKEKMVTATGKLITCVLSDYWNQNNLTPNPTRAALGLTN